MFSLEVLSPTHIGNGNKLSRLDYGVKDGNLYVFNLQRIMEGMNERNIERLISFMEDFGKDRSFQDLGDLLKQEFRLTRWENLCSYIVPIAEHSGRIRDINENIKTGNRVYIPGSSLKGAIRTAITYCLLKHEGYKFELGHKEIEEKDRRGNNKSKKRKVTYLILVKPDGTKVEGFREESKDRFKAAINVIESEINRELFGGIGDKDILKVLNISDSEAKMVNDSIEVRKVYVANTSSFVKIRGKREIKMHPEYYECIKSEVIFKNIHIKLKEKLIETCPMKKYKKALEYIKNWKKCVYEFTKDLLEAEIEFWKSEKVEGNISKAYGSSPHRYIVKKFNKEEVIKQLEKIKSLNTTESPVIRLGKLAGYFPHSVGLLLVRNGYDMGDDVAKIIFPFQHSGGPHPFTRRLTLDNQTLGWCRLEVN